MITTINQLEESILIKYYMNNDLHINGINTDNDCHKLLKLIKDYPSDFKASKYYLTFKDFNSAKSPLNYHIDSVMNKAKAMIRKK